MKKNLFPFLVLLMTAMMVPTVHAQNFTSLTPLWNLKPGERPYLTATFGAGQGDNLQRGMAYNPATDHVLIVSRTNSSYIQGIFILDASTGADVAPFSLNTNGISNGGTFILSKIAVADDGVIYAANFGSQPGTTNTIYRWANESAAPTIAFAGNPGVAAPNTNNSWGTTFDVRGSGTGTQIILGCNGTIASVLTTADGVNFTPTVLATDAAAGDFEFGSAFGAGDTFWGKNVGRPLRKFSFNIGAGTAVTVGNYNTNLLPASFNLGQIGVNAASGLLAALDISSNLFGTVLPSFPRVDHVRLYDISNPSIAPVLLDVQPFAYTNVNRFVAGAIDFGGGKLFALNCNNGISAFTVNTPSPLAPALITPVAAQRILAGRDAYLTAIASRVTSYQWQRNGTDIVGATNAALSIANAQVANSGLYNVIMSNLNGTISSSAQLSVYDSTNYPHLSPLWSYNIGNVSPPLTVGASQTPFQRSIAYNSLSNQVIYIDRTTAATLAGLTINVLDADSGAFLYTLNKTGITGGAIILLMIDVAEDGVVYAANMQANASTGVQYKVYRWSNSGSNTVPTLAWQGEPASQLTAVRWGDSMDVRSSGVNTEIILDAWDKEFGSLLTTTDGTNFVNPATGFFQYYYRGTIGRSLQFGETNTFWQKRRGDRLYLSSYDTVNQTSSFITNYNFPDSIGPVEFNFSSNLLAAISFSGRSDTPDTLDLYEVSDLNAPLYIDSYNFPTNEQPNSNMIGQSVFGGGKVFSVNGNNGIIAFKIQTGGATTPPNILIQPENVRTMVGRNVSLSVVASDVQTYQWQFNNVNIAGATDASLALNNIQLTDDGAYRVVLSNEIGITISSNAIVTVESPADFYQLSQIWSAAPGSQPYATSIPSPGNSPNERTLAYSSISNQLYVVQKISASDFSVYVLNPDTGALLYELDVTGVFGNVPTLGGATGIALDAIGVADDGAIYVSNETPDGAGVANPDGVFRLYRWANSVPGVPPVQVFQGDPANQVTSVRWGDVMSVRGSGVNTEIILDANQGTFGSVLRPVDSSMSAFANAPFATASPSVPIGRSLQFDAGNTNTYWQKRSGNSLTLSSFDLATQTSATLSNFTGFATAVGPVALATDKNLLAGIRFAPTTSTPDTVELYEIADLQNPFLLGSYNFPTNKQGNANFIGQVIFTSNKVFALDGNNGIVAFNLVAPSGPTLTANRVGTDIHLSWNDGTYILQSTTNLTPTIIWSDISTLGQTSAVQNATSGNKFYRLKK